MSLNVGFGLEAEVLHPVFSERSRRLSVRRRISLTARLWPVSDGLVQAVAIHRSVKPPSAPPSPKRHPPRCRDIERCSQALYDRVAVELLLGSSSCDQSVIAAELFAPRPRPSADQLVATIDRISLKEGRGAVRIGRTPEKPKWAMSRDILSQHSTTCWDELIGVRG